MVLSLGESRNEHRAQFPIVGASPLQLSLVATSVAAHTVPMENMPSAIKAVQPTPAVPISLLQQIVMPKGEASTRDPKYEKLEAVVATLQASIENLIKKRPSRQTWRSVFTAHGWSL